MRPDDLEQFMNEMYAERKAAKAPPRVKPVPRFESDMKALRRIFDRAEPPRMPVRSGNITNVFYGFGDASGNGFGSAVQCHKGLSICMGVWGKDEQSESSNFREFENMVATLEGEGRKQNLQDTMLFFFTDNSTVEGAIYKGTSASPKLLDLVIRFIALQSHYDTQIMVSHVSGKRMIAQGADGLSRGAENEGVLRGKDMMSFIPLHLSPFERSSTLLKWVRSWTPDDIIVLQPQDWYVRGHDIIGGSNNED